MGFRNLEFVKNMGFNLKDDVEAYSFKNFVKEMFFDSDTDMIVISGVPGKEKQKDAQGKTLEGAARTHERRYSAELADVGREEGDQRSRRTPRARCARAISRRIIIGIARRTRRTRRQPFEQMDRELNLYGINSWKWYCHTDPGRSGGGFQVRR